MTVFESARIGESNMRSEAFIPEIGQSPRANAPLTIAREQDCARNPPTGFGVVGPKSVQRSARPVGGRFASQRKPIFRLSLREIL